MSTNIIVTRYGQIHYIAGCNDCDFSDAICVGHSSAAVRSTVRKHVARTGHTAWIEAGTHTVYKPSNPGSHPTACQPYKMTRIRKSAAGEPRPLGTKR